MPVVVRGLEVLENPPDKAAQLLLGYPAAPYTAFLISETGSTQCFQQHCLRLKEGLQALASQSRPTCEVTLGEVTLSDITQRALAATKAAVLACRAEQQNIAPIMVTLVLDNRYDRTDNWLLAHAAGLPSSLPRQPVMVVCAAPPRILPVVKHTQWIHARQQYSKGVPDIASEGLICSSDGQLLEGFISNLLIVECRDNKCIVRTAVQNVLPGIMQQQVMGACQALGIPLECTAAKQDGRSLWVEAFLTNAVRGLRPISKIACLPGNPFGWDPWECSFAVSPQNSICAKLQEYLKRRTVDITKVVHGDAL